MNFYFLFPVLFPLIIFIIFLFFLTKRLPQYFPKDVIFRFKSLLILILDIILFYLLFISYSVGFSSSFIENGIPCYGVTLSYRTESSYNIICSKILNNLSPVNFFIFSIIILFSIIIINYLFFRKNPNFKKILFKNVYLFEDKKEGKVRKGFLTITLIITLILIIFGYMFFSRLI